MDYHQQRDDRYKASSEDSVKILLFRVQLNHFVQAYRFRNTSPEGLITAEEVIKSIVVDEVGADVFTSI
jgi:hypothetical protein